MTCGACVSAVERALLTNPGVKNASVSLMGKRGQVFYLPSQVSVESMIDAVISAGFEASLFVDDNSNATTVYTEEANYYRGQFLGSLPFSFGALLVSKIIPLLGPAPLVRTHARHWRGPRRWRSPPSWASCQSGRAVVASPAAD